jgi:PHS family inorganic phosphate transporter-like MFS transporter
MNNFNWRVFAVAASGFFTDSYNLFATNVSSIKKVSRPSLTILQVILPSIAFVYWQDDTNAWRETLINGMTLSGSILGQILFGYLADRYGRTRLYGIELVIVIFSTIGVASSTSGVGKDMAVLGWLSSWRFLMGVGIGAECEHALTVI